jgi:multisubunit Na+/H+ antiporter MnhF subunit
MDSDAAALMLLLLSFALSVIYARLFLRRPRGRL